MKLCNTKTIAAANDHEMRTIIALHTAQSTTACSPLPFVQGTMALYLNASICTTQAPYHALAISRVL